MFGQDQTLLDPVSKVPTGPRISLEMVSRGNQLESTSQVSFEVCESQSFTHERYDSILSLAGCEAGRFVSSCINETTKLVKPLVYTLVKTETVDLYK